MDPHRSQQTESRIICYLLWSPGVKPHRIMNQEPPIEPVSARFPALEEQEIILACFDPEAMGVNVAGNFNNWCPTDTPLKNTGDGKWVVRLLLRSGQYEYRFLVDGRWSEDPQATQRAVNPYGGFNSIFTLPLAVKTSIL